MQSHSWATQKVLGIDLLQIVADTRHGDEDWPLGATHLTTSRAFMTSYAGVGGQAGM